MNEEVVPYLIIHCGGDHTHTSGRGNRAVHKGGGGGGEGGRELEGGNHTLTLF